MRPLRRLTQLLAAASITAAGCLLMLELIGATGDRWRLEVADALKAVFAPSQPEWALALLGVAAAVTGIILIAAQLAPEPKGRARMHEVSKFDDGTTRLAGRAALRAVEHELSGIDGVTAVTAVMPRAKKVMATIRVDDRCDLDHVITEAHERLGTPFWIDLGLPDLSVEITAEFDPRPPRVR